MNSAIQQDPQRDLRFQREVDVPRVAIWRAWTEPERLMPWFCPLPWKTVACEIDLRPGGLFSTTMESPQGERFPNRGCYLEVRPQSRLVWTNALGPDWRPTMMAGGGASLDFAFTAIIDLADSAKGCVYTATVMHADEESCRKHVGMGFEQGWGIALDQMVSMIRRGPA